MDTRLRQRALASLTPRSPPHRRCIRHPTLRSRPLSPVFPLHCISQSLSVYARQTALPLSSFKMKKWCIFQTFHSKYTPFHRSIVHGCDQIPAALSFFILPQPPYFAAASAPRAYSSSSSLSMSSLGKSIAPFSTLQPSIL